MPLNINVNAMLNFFNKPGDTKGGAPHAQPASLWGAVGGRTRVLVKKVGQRVNIYAPYARPRFHRLN